MSKRAIVFCSSQLTPPSSHLVCFVSDTENCHQMTLTATAYITLSTANSIGEAPLTAAFYRDICWRLFPCQQEIPLPLQQSPSLLNPVWVVKKIRLCKQGII
jgi:hypothetical protein